MTLRVRLVLAFGMLALLIASLYGSLTYVVFERQQWGHLERVLERELDRMQGGLSNPRLGVPLASPERSGTVIQLVTEDGRVVLPRDGGPALPPIESPDIVEFAGGNFLTATRPLNGGSSVRVGLDVTDEIESRSRLRRQLLWLGLLMSLVAALLGGLVARSALFPLASLARQAREIDPAAPQEVEYRGPPDEVAEVANALNAALGNIRRRQAQERAFLGEVAHELAAPLTLVKGHLDAYRRSAAEGEASRSDGERHLEAAREAAQELLLTSQDLLALARGELERTVQTEVLRLDELLQRLGRAYPGIAVRAAPVRVVGDGHLLFQAIRNLVRNAVQASGGPEGVSVELDDLFDVVELRVRDHGPGIPPERLEMVFQRYYSGSSGAGVGLTVVSRIVEQHNGELRVDSGPGGSCFTIVLPSFDSQLATAD